MSDMKRCDGCKHWDMDSGKAFSGTGLCTKARPLWDVSEWDRYGGDHDGDVDPEAAAEWTRCIKPEFADLKMFCQDGSDYRADLLTKPDFFCAHHEVAA